MAVKKWTYQEKAERLVKLVEIAEKVVTESTSFPQQIIKPMLAMCVLTRNNALNPEPQFKSVVSLKYSESDFLVYWNESGGYDTELFWNEVAKSNLNFVRKDTIKDVLTRKRINNIHEFDIITDSLVPAEQLGRITSDEARQLGEYLEKYEAKRRK